MFFFSLFAFYLLVEDMGWLARLLCILCVLGTLGVCLAFQVWFYRIVQSRRREEQRLALAQECVRQQSLRPRGANYLSGKYGYLGTGIGLSSVQEVVAPHMAFFPFPAACVLRIRRVPLNFVSCIALLIFLFEGDSLDTQALHGLSIFASE